METRAGDPGAFRHFDLSRVDTPAFVVDAAKLRANLQVLADIRDAAECKVLLALKAFSMWSAAPIIGEYLDGVCTSGLWEARLASEFYDGEISTYSPAYKPDDLLEVCRLSDHVIFNSPGQLRRAALILEQARSGGRGFDIGLRINPQVPTGEVPRYDPSSSRQRGSASRSTSWTSEHHGRGSTASISTICASRISRPLAATWDKCVRRHRAVFRPAQMDQHGRRPPHHPRRLPAGGAGGVPARRAGGYGRGDLPRTGRGGGVGCGHPCRHGPRHWVQRGAHGDHRHLRHLPYARCDRSALPPGHAG